MKKTIINSMFLAGIALSGAVAFGQTDGVTPTVTIPMPVIELNTAPTMDGLKSEREAIMESTKAALQKLQEQQRAYQGEADRARTQLRTEQGVMKEQLRGQREVLKQANATSTEALNLMREAIKKKAETAREAIKTSHEEFKSKMETAREEIKTKRQTEMAALKVKLEAVKDARKKEAVERLDKRFDEINAKMTSQWTNTLARLEELLTKITSRADKAALSGTDVSAVRAGVEKAKLAITAARTAVVAQAAKTYPISVTTETALKSAVAQTRELLNKDLQAARNFMQAAHKAISDSASSLRAVPKVDDENGNATTTPPVATTTSATSTQ